MRIRKAKATDLTWEEKNPAVYGKLLTTNEDFLKELKAKSLTVETTKKSPASF